MTQPAEQGKQHREDPVNTSWYDTFPGEVPPVIDFGDPTEAFGVNSDQLFVDKHVYVIKHEHPIGKIGTMTGDRMDLTADVVYHAMRLRVMRDEVDAERGGTWIYILTHDAPPLSWDQVDMEAIEPDWPLGIVDWEEGTLPELLQRTNARKLRVNIDDLIRERGGDPEHRSEKPLRIHSTNLP
jgi:hypothetical protein